MHNPLKVLTIAMLLGTSAIAADAQTSVLRPSIGTIIVCPATWTTIFTSPTFGDITFAASAEASFETSAVTALSDEAGSSQTLQSISASATTKLGTISWEAQADDGTRTTTKVAAQQKAADFPATSDIYFTPTATISSQPGAQYVATREVHLQSTNLTSFNPQRAESYSVVGGPIDFKDEETGEVAFTIELTDFKIGK